MKKSILSLALAFILTLALVPAAFAAETISNDAFTITNVIHKGAYDAWQDEDGEEAGLGGWWYIVSEGATLSFPEPRDYVMEYPFTNPSVDGNKDLWFDWVEEDIRREPLKIEKSMVLNTNMRYSFGHSYATGVYEDGFEIWDAVNIEIYVVDNIIAANYTGAPTPSGKTATPTASTVYVNGKSTPFEAYTMDGNNYFKLRDLATVLNGTGKQFEVGYNSDTKVITLTSGKSYTTVGGEMAAGDGKAKTATPTASKIYLDGKELSLTVYTINGNNFFKLRDLMQAMNVYVGYDDATRNITLDTSNGYVVE